MANFYSSSSLAEESAGQISMQLAGLEVMTNGLLLELGKLRDKLGPVTCEKGIGFSGEKSGAIPVRSPLAERIAAVAEHIVHMQGMVMHMRDSLDL